MAALDHLRKIQAAITGFTSDPRYKWYQRGVWIFSAVWAAVVVAQSVSYYTYIGKGKAAQQQGQYQQAEDMFKAAWIDVQNSFSYRMIGKRDSRYANALNNLAELYRTTGRYKQAEAAYEEVLAASEKHPGKNHQAYAISLNNLAAACLDEGEYARSEKLYKAAIEAWMKQNRTGDSNYAASLNGLAKLYRETGKYAQAEQLYKKAIAVRSAALGSDHQDVAELYGNLGTLYRDEGRYGEARNLYIRALKDDATALGAQHPYVAGDYHNIGALDRVEHKYADADAMYKKALAIRTTAMGKGHPYTAKTLLGLALSAAAQKRFDDAVHYVEEAIEIDAHVFGKRHPDYATACDTACSVYLSRFASEHRPADIQKARSFNTVALDVRSCCLPADSPDLAFTRYQAAELNRLNGKFDDAKRLYQSALAVQSAKLNETTEELKWTRLGLKLVNEKDQTRLSSN